MADKLGNRYEAKWLIRQLLEVIGGRAQFLQYEGISADFKGFEFAIQKQRVTEWHQAKISSPHGNWTLAALEREGVLSAFKSRVLADRESKCVFVSQDAAKDIWVLAEKSRIATSHEEYLEGLGDGQRRNFENSLIFGQQILRRHTFG